MRWRLSLEYIESFSRRCLKRPRQQKPDIALRSCVGLRSHTPSPLPSVRSDRYSYVVLLHSPPSDLLTQPYFLMTLLIFSKFEVALRFLGAGTLV